MRKVLLVNDSRFEGIILKDILNTIGYDVRISDEYSAVKQLKSYEPDIVIVNLLMKEIRGDQLIAIIKVQNSKMKCVLCSSSPIRMEDFHFKKIDGVFQTPIDRPGLEKVLSGLKKDGEGAEEEESHKEAEVKPEENALPPPDTDTVRFCRQCGHKLDAGGFAFCPYCGSRI